MPRWPRPRIDNFADRADALAVHTFIISAGPIEPDHPVDPGEPAQPDDPPHPGPEPTPVPGDPALHSA